MRHNDWMNTSTNPYAGHRYPTEIISHAVWLYHRFCLSLRDVEDLLAERGIAVSYESIRQWCNRFGPEYARKLKKRQGCPGPLNLYARRSNHSLMKLLPLLYSWMENSQEFVFRHSRCLPNLNRHEILFPRAGRGA